MKNSNRYLLDITYYQIFYTNTIAKTPRYFTENFGKYTIKVKDLHCQ